MGSSLLIHTLLVAALMVAVTGKSCPAGTYSDKGKCTPCYPGTFNPVANASCIACPAGSISKLPGATACTACPKNSITIPGMNKCYECPKGSLGPTKSKAACKCPTSQIWVPGYGMIGACYKCYVGYYCPVGARPQRCPAGTANPKEGAIDIKACAKCPKGTYAREGSDVCRKCPSSSYGPTADQSSCICPKDSWTRFDPFLECVKCPSGGRPTADQLSCACAAGRYFQASWMECITCEKGFYCPEGTSESPKQCPAGTYSPSPGASSIKTCKQCPKGTYSWSAAAKCRKCPIGAEDTPAGSEDCVCPPGTCAYIDSKECSSKHCQ